MRWIDLRFQDKLSLIKAACDVEILLITPDRTSQLTLSKVQLRIIHITENFSKFIKVPQ